MLDEHSVDGGLTALAGYLYQTVGVLGMRAGAHLVTNLTGSDDLEALLALVKDNELRYEYLDQDASIRHALGINEQDEYVLIQFKYSRQEKPPKIGPQELTKIINRLKESANRAKSLGHRVTGYALITNRTLGPEAQKARNAAQITNSSQQGSEAKRILGQLRMITPRSMADWEINLRGFAQTYGCLEADIREGIDELIGNTIRRTVEHGSPSITKGDLVQAFTGSNQARQLTPSCIAERTREQLEVFCAQHHITHKREQELVRRSLVLDTISQLANEHAIVIVYGLGGSGKTVALSYWIEEFLASTTSKQQDRYTAIMAAEEIQSGCLAHLLCNWAKLPAQHGWRAQTSPELVLERLHVASPGITHPILYLGIDAVDEERGIQDSTRTAIRELLRWFWKEESEVQHLERLPQATIVIACRDKMAIADQWLPQLNSPFGDVDQHLPSIEVGDFSYAELLEAAHLGLSEELSARIEKALSSGENGLTSTLDEYELPLLQKEDLFIQPIDGQILQALRHPALWRSLLALSNLDVQSCILDGDPDALHKLAEKFVDGWFYSKAQKRGLELRKHELKAILAAITCECQTEKPMRYSRKQWIEAACSTQLTVAVRAEWLYNEALSAGLIESVDLFWRWRHSFIGDYLMSGSSLIGKMKHDE